MALITSRRVLPAVFAFSFAAASPAAEKPRRTPELRLRASPAISGRSIPVLFTAELVGGQDTEDFYCPTVEWELPDGTRSVSQPDCEPYTEGSSIERRYTLRRGFGQPGQHGVTVRLMRKERVVAEAEAKVIVF